MSRNLLVTGGAGFIGSHLVEALLARGDRVVVLDDCSTGDLSNLAAVADHPALEIVHGSVCDSLVVDECAAQVDGIVHLAAAVGVMRILERRVHSIMVNLRGTEVVLQAALTHGRLPVLLASSSEVYGKGRNERFSEDDDCVLGPTGLHRWSYACSKAMDEFLALAHHHERDLPVRITRLFNITGPRQSPAYGMVLPRFCRHAVMGRPLEVYGDGEQTRCFLHIADCVDALLALLDHPAAVGRVVNVGGVEEVAIGALAQRVATLHGKGTSVVHVPYERAYPGGGFEDLRRRAPDTTRLRRLCDWAPTRDLDTIIRSCLAWESALAT